jgi:hypothetical protein
MDDLEEYYKDSVEKEEEVFLEGLQNKRSLAELEQEYSKKVKEIRRVYEKFLKKELNEEKEKEILKAKNKKGIQRGEERVFYAEGIQLEKNWEEKKQIEIESKLYKIKIKMKSFIQKITPNWAIYNYYKIKKILSRVFKEIGDFFKRIGEGISEKLLNGISFIGNTFTKIFLKITASIQKLMDKFNGKNKKDGKNNADNDTKKEPK